MRLELVYQGRDGKHRKIDIADWQGVPPTIGQTLIIDDTYQTVCDWDVLIDVKTRTQTLRYRVEPIPFDSPKVRVEVDGVPPLPIWNYLTMGVIVAGMVVGIVLGVL